MIKKFTDNSLDAQINLGLTYALHCCYFFHLFCFKAYVV